MDVTHRTVQGAAITEQTIFYFDVVQHLQKRRSVTMLIEVRLFPPAQSPARSGSVWSISPLAAEFSLENQPM